MVGEPAAAAAAAVAVAAVFVAAADALHQSILHDVGSVEWVESESVATWGGDAAVVAFVVDVVE
jgi:hypothetical protein